MVVADLLVSGDDVNSGTTIIQSGTLNILGTLANDGQLIGDFAVGGAARSSTRAS